MNEVWLPHIRVVPSKKTGKGEPTKRWFPRRRKSGPRTRILSLDIVYPPSTEEFAEMFPDNGDRMEKNEMRISIEERFWSKVQKGGTNECWNWKASTRIGYGQFRIGGKMVSAHRIALFGIDGPNLYDGYLVCAHRCDNRLCCNPSHLFICTTAGNNLDMVLKGRAAKQKGEAHSKAKLSEKQVISIKHILAHGIGTQSQIADYFGVDQATISHIKTGVNWSHV